MWSVVYECWKWSHCLHALAVARSGGASWWMGCRLMVKMVYQVRDRRKFLQKR